MHGVLVISKESGPTSRDVVNEVSKILNTKKIGHTGTLDPIASGLLVLCVGKATKLVNFITSSDKEYIASFKIGVKTDTGDITGKIIEEVKGSLRSKDVKNVFLKFPKVYNQEVPIYSAVKIKGKKLYEYARANEEVKLPSREVEIKELELIGFKGKTITFRALVSKGTYIRSLINDICKKLNTVGTMISLVRNKQGNFSIDNSFTVKEVANNKYKLITIKELFKDYEQREIDGEFLTKIKNGVLIDYDFEDYLVFIHKKDIIAIYQKYEKDSKFAKPLIIF
jgi:tRNA pseudouridine55 synthase